MADYTDDDGADIYDPLLNEALRDAINQTATAFTKAVSGKEFSGDDVMFAAAETIARIANAIFAGMVEVGDEEEENATQFREAFVCLVNDQLLDVMSLDAGDDEEINEDMLPFSMTTH